jgi:hypothetical protein
MTARIALTISMGGMQPKSPLLEFERLARAHRRGTLCSHAAPLSESDFAYPHWECGEKI